MHKTERQVRSDLNKVKADHQGQRLSLFVRSESGSEIVQPTPTLPKSMEPGKYELIVFMLDEKTNKPLPDPIYKASMLIEEEEEPVLQAPVADPSDIVSRAYDRVLDRMQSINELEAARTKTFYETFMQMQLDNQKVMQDMFAKNWDWLKAEQSKMEDSREEQASENTAATIAGAIRDVVREIAPVAQEVIAATSRGSSRTPPV